MKTITGSARFEVVPGAEALLAAAGVRSVHDALDPGLGAEVTRYRTSWVRRVPAGESAVYVKAYVFPTAKDVWRQVTSRRALTPRARREWRSLALQQDIGLPVVRRVAIGDIRRFGLVRAAVLVTEEMAGAQPLPAWLRERSWAVAPEILGAYVALLHERGFVHGDLNARNLLVRDLPDGGVDIRNLDAGCGRALRWRGEMTAAHARDVAPLVIAFEEILGRDAAAEYVRSYVTALGVERTAGMEQRLAAAVASVRPRESRRLR